MFSCDMSSALEDGGIGAVIGLVIGWVVRHFFGSKSPTVR